MLYFIIYFILCILVKIVSSSSCYHPDTVFINSNTDLELISHCKTINSSIFISGGYDITSLQLLSSLEYIFGYLVIIDSHLLRNLVGLHNLKRILGQRLYLDEYSVNIRHNTEHLCYTDHINWTEYTDNNTIISGNALDCPDCNSECNGCWGPGPQLCQHCNNLLSGITCVNDCPTGTTLILDNCIEYHPLIPILNTVSTTQNSISVNFNTDHVNGVTLGYQLLINDILYRDFTPNREIYSPINTIFNIYNLTTYTIYNFSIRILNSINWSEFSNISSIRTDVGNPPIPTSPHISLTDSSIRITLQPVTDVYGPIILYRIIDHMGIPIYSGNYTPVIRVYPIKSNIDYRYILEVYTSDTTKSISNYSNTISISSSISKNVNYILIITLSILGVLITGFIIYLLVKKYTKISIEEQTRRTTIPSNRLNLALNINTYNPVFKHPGLVFCEENYMHENPPSYIEVYERTQ